MTPARKAALQFFHDRGTIDMRATYADEPSKTMLVFMLADGHLDSVAGFSQCQIGNPAFGGAQVGQWKLAHGWLKR